MKPPKSRPMSESSLTAFDAADCLESEECTLRRPRCGSGELGLPRFVDRNLQAERRRSAGLSHRRPDQARQAVAGSADRRVDAVGLGRRRQRRPAGRVTDALTYAELDEILRGAGRTGATGMRAVDGLIAALVAAPSFVHPDEWIPLIFGGRQPPLHENSPELRLLRDAGRTQKRLSADPR